MKHIPFSPPDITEAEIQSVCDVLRSGWITTGERTHLFERELAAYCGTKKFVCLNSATAAEELVLRALGIGEGDEVIVPAYTYTATASAALHVGASVVMIDCAKDSPEMDYDQMERAISEKTRAIIPVDYAGVPCNYERIFEAVNNRKNVFVRRGVAGDRLGRCAVVADGAHSFGASRNGRMTGTLADFTTFSFHAVKNLTTAEGGAITWRSCEAFDDEELYKLFQLYSLHGQTKDAKSKMHAGEWEYDIAGAWYKCNMTDIQAALGESQLHRYPQMLKERQRVAQIYDVACDEVGAWHIDLTDSSYHLYIVRLPEGEDRNDFVVRMAELGVSCNVHYKPLPMMTAYRNLGFDIKDYPNAYDFFHNEVSLPLYSTMTSEEAEYVTDCMKKVLSGR